MLIFEGNLLKLKTKLNAPVDYSLANDSEDIPLNAYVGKTLHLTFSGQIHCLACHRVTSKSFNQGYCFPCARRLAQCDICIIRPEKCHYASGTCREPQWGLVNCMIPHIVYLANASGIKVGITRYQNMPTRWIDQGAIQALPVVKVSTRLLSGKIEVALAKFVSDKTHWQKMVREDTATLDLFAHRETLYSQIEKEIQALQGSGGTLSFLKEAPVVDIRYPILAYPKKVTALSFDKTPEIVGKLIGIKGQYLLFEQGVLNIRKHVGYQIKMALA